MEFVVAARREGPSLILEVRDDCGGVSLDTVPLRHGLDALIQRLHMLYQDTATLTVEVLTPGCSVRLTIPEASA